MMCSTLNKPLSVFMCGYTKQLIISIVVLRVVTAQEISCFKTRSENSHVYCKFCSKL